MNFSEIDPNSYDKKTFGKCIKEQREEQGLSLRYVASELQITPAYLCDIEKGNRYAPRKVDFMARLVKTLNINREDISYLSDMAGATRGFYEELREYIKENKNVRDFIRYAKALELTNEEWQEVFNSLNSINEKRRIR